MLLSCLLYFDLFGGQFGEAVVVGVEVKIVKGYDLLLVRADVVTLNVVYVLLQILGLVMQVVLTLSC